jgi:hypothetical protein
MFWVALATAIMMLSGEGDDTRAILALITGLRQAITHTVPAEARREQALRAITEFEQAFTKHREQLQLFGKCLEAADRNYHATHADYEACSARLEPQRIALRHVLDSVQHEYEAALSPAERAGVVQSVTALPQAWILDPALATEAAQGHLQPTSPARLRGVEGVAAQRHLTLPRNVVSVVYGPLGPTTFGQRYPSAIIDAGTSLAHAKVAGSNAPGAAAQDEWYTRLGVRFGLFDDIEAGALFLPLRLAPDFAFDPILVFLTQQFRLEALDIALRLSFQTPGDTGWALSPGVLLGARGRQLAFQAGVLLPMELGTFREPRSPLVGFNAPLRVTWNLVPTFFVSADTGLAYDQFDVPDGITVPLGFGAGYTLLAGSRLIEFTTSLTWDRWWLPSQPNDVSAFQFGIFRVALGATLYFQAL